MSVPDLPWISSSVEWERIQKVLKWTSSLKTTKWSRVSSLLHELNHVKQVALALARIENSAWLSHLFKDHVQPAMCQLLLEAQPGTKYRKMRVEVWKHFASWVIRAALEPGTRQSNKEYMKRVVYWKALSSFQPKKVRILENRLDCDYGC